MTTFTDVVVIEASNDPGLVVARPPTADGAGINLSTASLTSGLNWNISATGDASNIGAGKLNISATEVPIILGTPPNNLLTMDATGRVGLGTTSPVYQVDVVAPNQLGLRVTAPDANGIGAGIQLNAAPGTFRANSWEILATANSATQGPNRLNIRNLTTSKDILTIWKAAAPDGSDAVGIGTTLTEPSEKLEVNGNVKAFNVIVPSSRGIKENIAPLGSQEALGALEELRPVRFNYKTDDATKVHIGFVAEEVPELVATSDRKGVSIVDTIAILTLVVKEQQQTIKSLVEKTHLLASPVAVDPSAGP
jgi:hypothetical protein